MKIVLDPGHGGSDPGAVSKPLIESHLNLELALIIYATLAQDHEIVFTRTTDEYMGIWDRAEFANDLDADLFISLHHNSFRRREAHGVEILYYPGSKRGFDLAELILNHIHESKWPIFNRGVKTRPHLVVLKGTKMPAILIEAAFISSEIDRRETLLDKHYPEQKRWTYYCAIADAIKQSISEGG